MGPRQKVCSAGTIEGLSDPLCQHRALVVPTFELARVVERNGHDAVRAGMGLGEGVSQESPERDSIARPIAVLEGVLDGLEGACLVKHPKRKCPVEDPATDRQAIEPSRNTHGGGTLQRLKTLGTKGKHRGFGTPAAAETTGRIDDIEHPAPEGAENPEEGGLLLRHTRTLEMD